MAKHLAYEIQSYQMHYNDISLNITGTKYLHLPVSVSVQLKSV